MKSAEQISRERAISGLGLAINVQSAIAAGDEQAAMESSGPLMSLSPEHIAFHAIPEELEARAVIHQTITDLLVKLILAEDCKGEHWKALMLPMENGQLKHHLWISNAKWMRLFDVPLPTEYTMEPGKLSAMEFSVQAKYLGRFCATHDGESPLDFTGIVNALDKRLIAYFVCWTLGTYVQSPGPLTSESATENQASAMASFLEFKAGCPHSIPGSLMEITTSFLASYRSDMPLRPVTSAIMGGIVRDMFTQMRGQESHDAKVHVGNQLHSLKQHDAALLCPNWRNGHVAHRCLADLTRPMQAAGNPALLIHGPASASVGQRADGWENQSLEIVMQAKGPLAVEYGQVANEIKAANLDFLFYPEVTPANCTSLLATQRLARVQAVGYGFPITTGSPHMDYFVGGTEVESDGQEYCEQLVLLPGMGVSTTEPPSCHTQRERPLDDERVRVVSTGSHQKLNIPLLKSWESILQDKPLALLDLFPGMTESQAHLTLPAMGKYLRKSAVDLHPKVDRNVVMDTLADADLYLDTFPFGGFNSLVEVLVSGCPIVTLEGNYARQRFGAAMLRRLGLPGFLIAKNEEQYIAVARRLIEDAPLRADLRAQIGSRERVLAALADQDLPHHFAAAITWMRETGPRKRSAAPIVVAAGEKPRLLCA